MKHCFCFSLHTVMETSIESGIQQSKPNKQRKNSIQNYLINNRKGLKTTILLILLLTVLNIFHLLIQKINAHNYNSIFKTLIVKSNNTS